MDVHFVHQKSGSEGGGGGGGGGGVKNAIPLLFVHGWPGSWLEVTRLLPLLKGGEGEDGKGVVFEVVAPSLPNYGFSGGVEKVSFPFWERGNGKGGVCESVRRG